LRAARFKAGAGVAVGALIAAATSADNAAAAAAVAVTAARLLASCRAASRCRIAAAASAASATSAASAASAASARSGLSAIRPPSRSLLAGRGHSVACGGRARPLLLPLAPSSLPRELRLAAAPPWSKEWAASGAGGAAVATKGGWAKAVSREAAKRASPRERVAGPLQSVARSPRYDW
jgi:hypothetical protein